MLIRIEKTNEFDVIYTFIKEAFKTAQVSNGEEQEFVNTLRASKGYIPDLALVAEKHGNLVGHIMFTRIFIQYTNIHTEALLLAPLAVALEMRNLGVGSALVKEGISRARKLGYKSIFLAGDPAYYERFGFQKASNFNIKPNIQIPDKNALVLELLPGSLSCEQGIVNFI